MTPDIQIRMESRLLASMLHDPRLTPTVMHCVPEEIWTSQNAFRGFQPRCVADCIRYCWMERRDTSPLNVIGAAEKLRLTGVDAAVKGLMGRHQAEHVAEIERLARDYADEIRRLNMADALKKFQEVVADNTVEAKEAIRLVTEGIPASVGNDQNIVDAATAAEEIADMYQAQKRGQGQPRGVHTGFPKIDSVIGGLPLRKITIIGARPSQGKTALAGCIAINAARAGHPVIFFSHEMTERDVYVRMAAQMEQICASYIVDGTLSRVGEAKLTRALDELKTLPIHVIDSMHADPDTCRTTALYLIAKIGQAYRKPPLVIVDYVQLEHLPSFRGQRYEEIGKISWKWLETAKISGAAVLLLSQLNRDAVGQPEMQQLRESGSLEQDASVIGLLWRPSRDKKEGQDYVVSSTDRKRAGFNWGVLSIVKSRDSACTEQELHWTGYSMTFRGWDRRTDFHLSEKEQASHEYAESAKDLR